MHYCQSCDAPHLMVPTDDGAQCPACGRMDAAARRMPLFIVTGASGAGKSTLFPLLLERLSGRCLVFDVDWLIDPMKRADGEVDWDAFRDAWLTVAHGAAQNGQPVVLLSPFHPGQLDELPARAWVGDIHFLVLDCPDDERERRIRARPPWRARDIDQQNAFGAWLRDHVSPAVDTAELTPDAAADAVARWIDAVLVV